MNKFKRTLLFTVLGAMTFALPGCGDNGGKEEKKPANITLSCDFEGSEVERHQSIQFTFTIENGNAADVQYVCSSEVASISAEGNLTVSDSAAVGTEFSVYAHLGEAKSNEFSFKVKDTTPTALRVVASEIALKEDNEISFAVTYTPSYSTIKEYVIEAVGENASLVEVNDNIVKLAQGVDYAENYGKAIEIHAKLVSKPDVFGKCILTVGEVVGFISVENVNMIVKQEATYTVQPVLYGDDGSIVTPSLDFVYESSNEDVFKVNDEGKITPVGHGTADLKVAYGSKEETASVNIIMSADSIEIDNVNPTMVKQGVYFGIADTYPLSIINHFDSEKYKGVSNKYNYAFKLFDDEGAIVEAGDSVATIDANKKITFKKVGKVQMDVTTDSSLNDVLVPADCEETTSFFFNVNEGVNVKDFPGMVAALTDGSKEVINFLGQIDVTDENVTRDGGVGSNTPFTTVEARGNKYMYGNGFDIDLRNLGLDIYREESTSHGADFIRFIPAAGHEHEKYTVQIFDLGLYGSTDYNGYNAPVDNPFDTTTNNSHWAFNSNKKFARTFRCGFRVGTDNDKFGFIDKDGNHRDGHAEGDQFAPYPYYNAYIDDFKMTNVTVRGFYWGVWASHVIGTTENFNVYDCVEKGLLNCQSQLTMHNTTFGRVGGFATEISLDGVNDQKHIGSDDHYPTAGANYNEKPYIDLTGSVSIDNYNAGSDTLYMMNFNEDLAANPIAQAKAITSTNDLIEMVFDATAQAIAGGDATGTAALSAFWKALLCKDPAKKDMNFFNLAFMFDLGLSGKGNQTADYYAKYYQDGVDLAEADLQSIMEAYASSSGESVGYKAFKFISCTIALPGMYLGKVVLSNQLYDPTYNPTPSQE